MPKTKAKQPLKTYSLRVPGDLYDAIEGIAEAELRTVNSQMLIALREWVAQHQTLKERPTLQPHSEP